MCVYAGQKWVYMSLKAGAGGCWGQFREVSGKGLAAYWLE